MQYAIKDPVDIIFAVEKRRVHASVCRRTNPLSIKKSETNSFQIGNFCYDAAIKPRKRVITLTNVVREEQTQAFIRENVYQTVKMTCPTTKKTADVKIVRWQHVVEGFNVKVEFLEGDMKGDRVEMDSSRIVVEDNKLLFDTQDMICE